MANILEYLKDGKVDFVYNLTDYDFNSIVNLVRKAPNRIEIINGFLPKLKKFLPYFCFHIIYDIPEFANEAYEILNIKNVTPEMLKNMLYNSPIGLQVLYENFEKFTSDNEDNNYFDVVVKYAFDVNNKELLHKLSRYDNLHTRYLFMDYLIENHNDKIDEIYDDITKYTTSITYEPKEQITFLPRLMEAEDISKLAVKLLINNRKEDYNKLKDFILKEYKTNFIAHELLKPNFLVDPESRRLLEDPNKQMKKDTFNEDPNNLFLTSLNYRFSIYLKHDEKIKKELLDTFENKIKYYLDVNREDEFEGFFGRPEERDLELVYLAGLGDKLEEWTEKYLDLSKSKEYGFVGNGSTSSCYRIGDYVIKFIKTKWSYEDIICPNLYLITKDYEEIYVRRKDGIVDSGLEVQKYLTRSAKELDPKYFEYFDLALDKLGYRRTDTLKNGTCGENTMLLDSYLDADCTDPEKLPDWFKECPLVLIDRDRIYPKNKEHIKQLRSGY